MTTTHRAGAGRRWPAQAPEGSGEAGRGALRLSAPGRVAPPPPRHHLSATPPPPQRHPLTAKTFPAACRPPSLTLGVTQARSSGLADWVRPRDCRVCSEVNPRSPIRIPRGLGGGTSQASRALGPYLGRSVRFAPRPEGTFPQPTSSDGEVSDCPRNPRALQRPEL